MLNTTSTDVLVIGGGPVGLAITHILVQAGVNVILAEQYDKEKQALLGRASMLYSAALEFLDTIGMVDHIADIGHIVTASTTMRDGKEVDSMVWHRMLQAVEGKTFFDYMFSCRQMHLETALRAVISEHSAGTIHVPARLVAFSVNNGTEYPIMAHIEMNGQATDVRSKFIIGADGGRSSVRSLAQIPFPGTPSPFKWVRLDAVLRTSLPRRGIYALESPTHGSVLLVPLDNGRTRIGFVCPDTLYGVRGEGLSAEIVMEEAKLAVAPVHVEFVRLEWWTVYQFGQRVAERFRDGPVILAGDAAHTHSSGAAQGMNTGLFDAANLGWKLAGVLRGWFKDSILDTYASERKASAEQLIALDRDISSLISGTIPAHFDAPVGAEAHNYLDDVFEKNSAFTVGLGVSYSQNLLNQSSESDTAARSVLVGHRAVDVQLHRSGRKLPQRLFELTPYTCQFRVLVFAGAIHSTGDGMRLESSCAAKYKAVREYLDSTRSFIAALAPAFAFLTILCGEGAAQSAETLGTQPLGQVVYDRSGGAYEKYGVDPTAGALIVLRPDLIVCRIMALTEEGAQQLDEYFTEIVEPVEKKLEVGELVAAGVAVGEIATEERDDWEGACTQLPMAYIPNVDNPVLRRI